ncbi:restriction endonuclease subunit S [Ruminococcus sp.]|uniref:restriction endonuclease subunit S n=1 Tax=Ruminococcus sp. TaxID=41978 RepID=UPI00399497F1
MTSEWRTIRAADFIDFNPRLSLKKGDIATKVAMDKLKPFTKKIPETEKAEFNGGAKFCNGDTVMARITPCLENGKTAYVDMLDDGEIGFGSTEFIVMRAKTGISDPQFVYYTAINPVFRNVAIKSMVGSSGRQRVQQSVLEELELSVPDLDEQRRIGDFLARIDEKIALNDRINDNLQQQAAALFSSLYDRSNTEVRFTDLIQILGGGTPKTGENTYWNGNIAFFTPKDVGIPYTLITEKTISKEGLSHCNSRLYPVNTVFVTARGTVGKVGMSGVPMAMNQSCYALVGKETHQLLVYFYTLKAVDRLKHKASGAVFDAITTRDFESEQIMKLSDDDATAFLRVAEPMFQEVLNNNIENLRLSTLRDSLLPKLMSGEIDVSAVQL